MKKPCANCGKRIARAAPLCTFCGQAQLQSGPPPPWAPGLDTPSRGTLLPRPSAPTEDADRPPAAPAPAIAEPVSVAEPEPAAAAPVLQSQPPPAMTEPGVQADVEPATHPAGEEIGPILLAEPASEEEEPPKPPPRPMPRSAGAIFAPAQVPLLGRARVLHSLGGAALLFVFFLPWQGAHSWEMLRYLQGADFVRQLGLLIGGAVLLSTGLLPVPPSFRAACGVLFGLGMLGLGGVMLNIWQRLLGVLVAVLLPASLLVRTHQRRARLPRLLGLMAVLSLLSLYIVPRDEVAPIRVAVDLVYYQKDDMARFIGTYLLLPLPLVSLSTVALLGADVAIIGELLSWLLLCWGPGALLILAIDNTQAYMAAVTLTCAACAAYGAAELLRRITKTVEPER